MKNFAICAGLILSGIVLLSFKISNSEKKKNAALVGYWITGEPTIPSSDSHIKVFEENGSYCNLGFEKGETVMTHKGTYQVMDNSHYSEHVTSVRFNAIWNLKNGEFINEYQLSKDKKSLVLKGVVYSKDGRDSLKWSHQYRRLQVPE